MVSPAVIFKFFRRTSNDPPPVGADTLGGPLCQI